MNLIEEIRNYILDRGLTVSKDWAEDIAISMVSTFSYNAHLYTRQGKIRPNLWFLYIGASRIAFKTLPLKAFYIPVLNYFKENHNIDLFLPTSFSFEGLVECLSKTQKRGVIIRDEFSVFLKGKDYLPDMMEFLSQLYDGFVQRRYTRKEKLEVAQGFYVNLIGTSTDYLYKVMKPEYFMQGLGNRFLYTLWNGEHKKWSDDDLEPNISEDLPSDLLEKLNLLTKIELVVSVSKKLPELMNKYTEDAVKLVERGKNLEASYRQDFVEKAIKLAMLRSIADEKCIDYMLQNPNNKPPEPTILDHHVEWVEKKIEKYWDNFQRLVLEWKKEKLTREEPIRSVEVQAEFVYDIIRKEGKIGRSELLQKAKIPANQLDDIIEHYLLPSGKIKKEVEPTAGRRRLIYVAVE